MAGLSVMNTTYRLLSLCMVIFLDALGGGMISPLINPLFFKDQGLIAHMAVSGREILYGISLGGFFFMAAIGAPVLGMLSDRYGRKKLLIACVAGSVIGYALSIVAVWQHSVGLFITGRLIDGLTAGCLGIAQAAVADMTDGKNKTKFIGYIFLSLSLGFMMAPVISGVLATFSVIAPFCAVLILAMLNVILLIGFFNETFTPSDKHSHWWQDMNQVIAVLKEPLVAKLFLAFTLMQLGWSFYVQDLALYLSQRFGYDTHHLSAFFFVASCGFVLANSLILPKLSNAMSRYTQVALSVALMTVVVALFSAVPWVWVMWLLVIPLSIGLASGYSTLNALISDAVPASRQGVVMGNIGAVNSICFALAALASGLLTPIALPIPFVLAALSLLASLLLFYFRVLKLKKAA